MRLPSKVAAYSNGAYALVVSGSYAGVVLAVAVFGWIAGGLAGIWLFVVTLPGALLIQFLPVQGDLYAICLTLGGLVQAWLLWLALRGGRPPRSRGR